MDHMELIQIACTMKPFGLTGELKVRPESSFPNRHESLKTVFYKKNQNSKPVKLQVRASRLHQKFWFLKFEDIFTPEDARNYSGGMLLIPKDERIELPKDKIYISDIVGFAAVSEENERLGVISEVQEYPTQELLVINRQEKQDMLVPWIKEFVLEIDSEKKEAVIDTSKLRGLYED